MFSWIAIGSTHCLPSYFIAIHIKWHCLGCGGESRLCPPYITYCRPSSRAAGCRSKPSNQPGRLVFLPCCYPRCPLLYFGEWKSIAFGGCCFFFFIYTFFNIICPFSLLPLYHIVYAGLYAESDGSFLLLF